MPMPIPNDGESQDDYVSRFMGDKTMMKDYPDQKQRLAVAYAQHRKMKQTNTKKFMQERQRYKK